MASDDEKARELAHVAISRALVISPVMNPRCDGRKVGAEHGPQCDALTTAIASALRDARAEGRREMRDEAAMVAFGAVKTKDAVLATRVFDAIRALPIATQATPVVAENASTQQATPDTDARDETRASGELCVDCGRPAPGRAGLCTSCVIRRRVAREETSKP